MLEPSRAWMSARRRGCGRRSGPRDLLPGRGRCGRVGLPEPELVPLRTPAGHEPAHARHRGRRIRLAAEFPHPRRAGVDVVDVEVGAGAPLAGLHVGDRQAGLITDACHVVLEGTGKGLELPAEQRAPELASLRGVVSRGLEVYDLTGHAASSRIENA